MDVTGPRKSGTNSKPSKARTKAAKLLMLPTPVSELFEQYAGYVWGYSPEYPETLRLPAFVDKRESHEAKQADCTVLVLGIVMALTIDTFNWTRQDYRDGTLQDPAVPWSSPAAWSRASGREDIGAAPTPGYGVWAVQGLSGLQNGAFGRGTHGHQWLEYGGYAWHLSKSTGLTRASAIPGYSARVAVRIA